MGIFQAILFTYILGFGLQSFAIFLCIYLFNRQKIMLKNYLYASFLMSIVSGLIRLLPISIGIHTIINMLFTYLICVIFLKMPAYKTIRTTSLCVVLILICEMIVTTIIMLTKGNDYFEILMDDSLKRSLIGDMANIIFALFVIVLYFISRKKGDQHRNIGSQNS